MAPGRFRPHLAIERWSAQLVDGQKVNFDIEITVVTARAPRPTSPQRVTSTFQAPTDYRRRSAGRAGNRPLSFSESILNIGSNNNIEQALRALKRKCSAGIFRDEGSKGLRKAI
jgi:hypothetical protein